jgi:exodeoxyribonuclease VII small subunit
MTTEENRSFEVALAELEEHVRRLDGGELSLEESLTTFESGVKLIRECSELLDDAEQRITELTDTPKEDEVTG